MLLRIDYISTCIIYFKCNERHNWVTCRGTVFYGPLCNAKNRLNMNNKHMPLPLGALAYNLKDSCCQLAVSVA